MKTFILKFSAAFLLLALMGTGCEKEENEELIEIELLKFADFGCEEYTWNLKAGYTNNYYIVNSQQELISYIKSNCIPQIDFNEYFVIIGSKGFATGVSLIDEKVEEDDQEIVYTVTFLTNLTMVASGAKYHAVIKKSSDRRKIRVVEVVKDHI